MLISRFRLVLIIFTFIRIGQLLLVLSDSISKEIKSNINFKNMEGGDGRPIGNLARQSSIYTLTFDEFQNTLGGPGKDFGSMNMEEFLKNIWTADEMQAMASSMGSAVEPSSTGGTLQRQGSLTLPRTLSQKTVDEVWRDLYQGTSEKDVNAMAGSNFQQQQETLGEITLEEFLVKAGVVKDITQIAARPNNSSGFYSELSQSNNNSAAFPFGYQQLNQSSNGLDGIGVIDNKATICNISQMPNKSPQLPINVNGVPAQQQIFLNQTTVSYGPSMHTVEASNPSMRGTTISDSMIGNGLGQGVAAVGGAQGRAGGVDLGNVTTRPPNQLPFAGIGKRNRDNSSLSPVPYIFSGSLRGRRCSGAVEKVVERRQRRMIKNRESAARSRARKQAYTVELEAEIVKLKEENQALQKKQAELLDMRKKQLLEILNQRRVSKKQCIGRTRTGPW